jgi:hypothetical protein
MEASTAKMRSFEGDGKAGLAMEQPSRPTDVPKEKNPHFQLHSSR